MFGSIKAWIYGVAGILVLVLLIKAFTWFTGIQAEVGNLREANAEFSIQLNALEAEKKNNQVVIDSLKTALKTQAEALTIIHGEFGDIRERREQEKRVLDGSRLGRLAAERAALIESKSNAATREVFTEFEGVINEKY